jgi:L-seryl-tRNA(Ser) seleniumtransferase
VSDATADPRRSLPQVERLARVVAAETDLPKPVVIDAVRIVIGVARKRARKTKAVPTEEELLAACRDEIRRREASALRPVINATGVVLHTNLGRAPLSQDAIDAVIRVAGGYSNLEFDTGDGRRGDRFAHVEPLLALLVGAGSALVVNNNAAAVLLVCAALATGREVVISRGELIEIGGSFRIPDVIASSGAVLREVGTTNKTHLRDYETGIGDNTALILKVHPSNYRVVGFVASPDTSDLAGLAHRSALPLVYDVGSGLVGRTFADEPSVDTAINDGADLVCFSGDKLFGGPQAGIIAGRRDLIDELRSHPLLRALRPDKMQLAALAATTNAYLEGKTADIPAWRMLEADPAAIARRASTLVRAAKKAGYVAEVVDGESVPGGGSLPGHGIATTLVRIKREGTSAKALADGLRTKPVPVIARVEDGWAVFDLRTVAESDDATLRRALTD